MTLRTVTGCALLSIAAFIVLFSCSRNPAAENSPTVKSNLTAQEHEDLVKMANTITKVVPISDPGSQSSFGTEMAKKHSEITDGCDNSTPGMTICTFQTERGYDIDTTWLYSDAAKTVPVSDPTSLIPGNYYYSVSHMVSSDARTKYDIIMNYSYREVDYMQYMNSGDDNLTALYNSMDMKADILGTIDYFNDDLLLEFHDTGYQMKNGVMSGEYNFRIMDGRYDVTMHFEMPYSALLDETGSEELIMQGPITNRSGEQIGIFTVDNEDGSVRIYDNQGNLVKTAG